MSDPDRCDEVRELAPEAALGVSSGEERAAVLEHVTYCADCREHLDELARTADELLRLAPAAEPPAGFETRVLHALQRARGPRGAGRLVRVVAASLAGAVVVGVAAFFVTSSDRRLAGHYRAALAEADGKYFDVASLTAMSGAEVGHVFAYEGTPSWIVVVLESSTGVHDVTVTAGGRTHPVATIVADGDDAVSGAEIPVAVHDIDAVLVRRQGGSVVYRADF